MFRVDVRLGEERRHLGKKKKRTLDSQIMDELTCQNSEEKRTTVVYLQLWRGFKDLLGLVPWSIYYNHSLGSKLTDRQILLHRLKKIKEIADCFVFLH